MNKYKRIKRNWKEVKKIGKKFEKKYKKEINKITRLIPKIVRKPWRKKEINVYIVDWAGPSFSHPLTLKVRKDLLLMLVILTHELLHHFYTKKFYLDEEGNETKINKKVKEVFEKLKLDVKKQLKTLQKYHNKRFSK
ncbi:hypothetical protein DRJ22_00790 [Candidatus Woesearchaeota archaeon]|nr:MAG: hypothetical protein B6U93_02130 [Candidatus Woesearchaeota archaeon ex4484_78]RLE46894.1 MAG: hypothetical protein DRJ22_00790 [Candidatus Woesearchaeota archaeon]